LILNSSLKTNPGPIDDFEKEKKEKKRKGNLPEII
jgi:hypothetical protein